MAAPIYTDPHGIACCAAITALGNRIGLYANATRAGTAYADTTWGTPTKNTVGSIDWYQSAGSKATITIPGGTVANGTVITHYGVHNGTTLLRRVELPVALTINDGSQAVTVDVTPTYRYRSTDS
ncbi:hypothetical protein ACXYTP_23330 [Tsukamurella ocularis]